LSFLFPRLYTSARLARLGCEQLRKRFLLNGHDHLRERHCQHICRRSLTVDWQPRQAWKKDKEANYTWSTSDVIPHRFVWSPEDEVSNTDGDFHFALHLEVISDSRLKYTNSSQVPYRHACLYYSFKEAHHVFYLNLLNGYC